MNRFLVTLFLVAFQVSPGWSDIRFNEVTREAGINHAGITFGASWGDLNKDGWPDLWVSNHFSKPSLYLNQQDGTFINVVDRVWSADPVADTHGAAWADFDNDGDQDLIELVGAQYGVGSSPNHFFVNNNGVLEESAVMFGLDQPFARGRTPMWFDSNRDGRLDVVLMNKPRPDGRAPSSLFLQGKHGFAEVNEQFEFREPGRTNLDKLNDLLTNVLHMRFGLPPILYGPVTFAQLADLSGDGRLDLVEHSPMRVFDVNNVPFEDITYEFGLPTIRNIMDVAIDDFDGDQQMDIFLSRSLRPSNVVQNNPLEIKGTLHGSGGQTEAQGIVFRADGEVRFTISPFKIRLSDIVIGGGFHPDDREFVLNPDDPRLVKASNNEAVPGKVIIQYSSDDRTWLFSSLANSTNFIVNSSQPIEIVTIQGFNQTKGELPDALLMRREADFLPKIIGDKSVVPSACYSVVAADFDNDMDLDLYLACAGPIENLPNILLKNDGKGNFIVVPDAGGAAGSFFGRAESVVAADYDRDGFIDLFVTNGLGDSLFVDKGPHQLFHNQGNENHWIEIDLQGSLSNRDGIGASVVVEAGGVKQTRRQDGGMHRYSQNHKRIHFGLGANKLVDELIVHWPSGVKQIIKNTDADQILLVREPDMPGVVRGAQME